MTGAGHLFKFDISGNLIADLALGEGSIYHPGGIDYDGKWIWVPVAEYRPNSRAIIYRVDPGDDEGDRGVPLRRSHRRARAQPEGKSLHGVSWGSRRFYRWTLDADGAPTNADTPPESCAWPTRRATSTTRTASISAARKRCAPGSTSTR